MRPTPAESRIVALFVLALTTAITAIVVVALDRAPARSADDDRSRDLAEAEYVEACEREHRSWCRECEP